MTTCKMNYDFRKQTIEEATEMLSARIGLVMAISKFSIKPSHYKFFQTCMSLQMWRQGASQKLFSAMSHLGISQGSKAARRVVDVIRQEHEETLKMWKEGIEVSIQWSP